MGFRVVARKDGNRILHAWAKTVGARAQTGQSGRQGQLEGKIQERYGIAKEEAQAQVDNYFDTLTDEMATEKRSDRARGAGR